MSSLDGQGLSRYIYRGTKLTGWDDYVMWDSEFKDYISMIPGLIAHFNGTATIPTNPNSVRTEKDPAVIKANMEAYENTKLQWKEYQALARTLLRQSCGNDNQKAKIAYLSDPCEMYMKLCSEYSQKMTLCNYVFFLISLILLPKRLFLYTRRLTSS